MPMTSDRWQTITPSDYEWERDALDFVRAGLPDHEPYRAWSNFEFQTSGGAIYEIDLLVLTKEGLFLVEIKSPPGRVGGDAGTWVFENDGRSRAVDNPLHLANRKSKALKSLLERQSKCFKKVRCPYVEAVVFLSDEQLRCDLQGDARTRVFLRDRTSDHPKGRRDGILAALINRQGPGLELASRSSRRGAVDSPTARAVSQAMDAAGIRPSQKKRRVGDYVLGELLDEGPGYQDYLAEHATAKGIFSRARRYLVAEATSEDERARLRRAALREFRILQTLEHEGILTVRDLKDHEFGPTLILQHESDSIGLDHFLATRVGQLSIDQKLDLLRQLADALRYAHRKKVIHRALSPKSVLVCRASTDEPTLKIFNWQVSTREGTETSFTGTLHVEELIEAPFLVYAAPESRKTERGATESADVFSLGAIAYHLFSGRPPASTLSSLTQTLREGKGLVLSSVVDAAGSELEDLVRCATDPNVHNRFATVDDFLEQLELVEEELTSPDDLVDPHSARKGERLAHGLLVERVLGKGSTSRALLVSRESRSDDGGSESNTCVLKVALRSEDNERLREEGQVLREMRSEYIVGFIDELDFGGTVGLLLETAGDQTLAEYLRQEGSVSLDLLERFGENLLSALVYLETQGRRHRDIKPENIGVINYQKKRKQLVLFDFSLAAAPLESIHVGTTAYLDPFLALRPTAPGKKPLWDESAERYSAAVTLHEMATGVRPRWGDGQSSPAETDDELVVEDEQLDASIREGLGEVLRKALARDVAERYANAEDMLRDWRTVFQEATKPEKTLRQKEFGIGEVALDTSIAQLELSTRAENALDRVNIVSVQDLLQYPTRELRFMRGVGQKTLGEILSRIAQLKAAFPDVEVVPPKPAEEADVTSLTIEALYRRALGKQRDARETSRFEVRRLLLGDRPEDFGDEEVWPTQTEIARCVDVTPGRVAQIVGKERARWLKDAALSNLRADLFTELERQGGVLTVREALQAILARRESDDSSDASGATLHRQASALARAAVEAEHALVEPRMRMHRQHDRVYIATSAALAKWARRLGEEADRIAAADPLLASARAIQRLRSIAAPDFPEGVDPPSDERLLRLAATASTKAAVSPRQEIYPRGMDPERALRLGAGAVRALGLGGSLVSPEKKGANEFSADDVRERIAARYPDAEELPPPPELTTLLARVGLDVAYDAERQVYARSRAVETTTSGSTILGRLHTVRPSEREIVTPQIAAARQFEEHLQHRHADGSFLVLTVRPAHMTRAESELLRRFELDRLSLDEQLIAAMRKLASEKKVDWQVVRDADHCDRDSRDWTNLVTLFGWAVDRVRDDILAKDGAVLLVHPGLLARYDHIGMLETLRDEVGKAGKVRTCWVLVPADEQSDLPVLDGKEIPLLSPGQRARVPREWIENLHRSGAEAG